MNSWPKKDTAHFIKMMEDWTEKMKLEFAVQKMGRHGKSTALPSFIRHPTESEQAYQKRKMDREEGESKRRRQSDAEAEVYITRPYTRQHQIRLGGQGQ